MTLFNKKVEPVTRFATSIYYLCGQIIIKTYISYGKIY